jgi:hypothetical protein
MRRRSLDRRRFLDASKAILLEDQTPGKIKRRTGERASSHGSGNAGCGSGSSGGRRPSLAPYFTVVGTTDGATAPPEGVNGAYARAPV